MAQNTPKSAVAANPSISLAAAIQLRPGVYTYPRGTIARTNAGHAMDLAHAADRRRAGETAMARAILGFARDARLFAPAGRLPG